MSTPIHFSQSSYFRANKGVDRYFLETYLLPGLVRQSVLAGGSKGVELPVGENQEPEYLSLEEAKGLVLDWLEQSQNLLEGDKKKLEKVGNYQQFANLASNIYESRVQDPNKLLTAARLQNVADLRAANQAGSSTSTPHFDPGKAIDEYNKIYLKLLSSSRQGVPQRLLQQIVSGKIPSGNGSVSEASLAAVISSNLNRLYAAGSVGTSGDAQNFAVSQELGRIISTSYPEMTSMLNILGDAQIASSLREVTNRLADDLQTTTSLENYEKVQVAAISATNNYLLNQTEIRAQIFNAFSSMDPKERESLTNTILSEIVSSARTPLTTAEIVERVSQKLNIPSSQLASIQSTLSSSGLSVSIEYRQNEISLMVNSKYLTAGEKKLLSKGINPFLLQNSPEKLVSLESKLLKEYNEIPGHNKEFIMLREAYVHEQQSVNPKQSFLVQARAHFDQLDSYNDLSLSEKTLIRRTRFGRWVADSRSRFYETQSKFFTKWGKIEDTLTGKKLINKLFDNWDDISKNITIPGTKIPLFKIASWLYDRFAEWKKARTLQIIANTSKATDWIGKTIHWAAKNYELGGYTSRGAIAHFASTQWGKVVKWGLVKTGVGSVFKYSARYGTKQVANAGMRTATRFLLKIGGKALAKFGAKALGALITTATAIGTVVFAISMIFDLVSMAWTFVKEFIRNSEFRKTIMGWGAAIGGVFAAINLGGIFLAIGAFFTGTIAGSLSLLILAFFVTTGAAFLTPQIQNNIKNTFRLDSEYIPPASSANLGPSLSCMSQGEVPDAVGPGVPTRAREIISDLHTGFWNYCNRPTNPEQSELYFGVADVIQVPGVYNLNNRPGLFDYQRFEDTPSPTREQIQDSGSALYWCTYLVQHSYRESGKTGLSYSLWSPTLEDEFRQKFTFVEGGAANSSNVKPGDVIFFKVSGGPDRTNHVGVINNVDPPGFTYFQSNAPTINSFGTFSGGAKDSSPGVEVVGFGRM